MHDNLRVKREKIKLERNRSLAGLTFFKSRGKCDYYAEPETLRELRKILSFATEEKLRVTVIGSGTHIILPDKGLDGILISMKNFKGITIRGELITAMAGESLDDVINAAIENHLMGLEELGGIPGTVAAAIRINATSQNKSIGEFHFYTDTITLDCRLHRRPHYKEFSLLPGEIIISTTLCLKEGRRTAEARIKKERFIELMFIPPCKNFIGSVFKDGEDYKAGELIKASGMDGDKGLMCEFSSFQSNCLFSYPECTEDDVISLIRMAKEKVYEKTGITLSPRVTIVSEDKL